MNQITIDSKQIAMFSDIHWGKSRNSDVKLKITEDLITEFIIFLKKHSLDTVFFLGDWFDNRNLVSVKTQNIAYDALKRITAENITVYMLVGNHDSYFKDNISVNSIRQYQEIENVHPILELTEVHFTHSDEYALLCPWDTLDPSIVDKEKYSVLFGHFEFQDAQYKGSVSKSGHAPNKLLAIADLVFTGHYHIRKEYNYKLGKIISIGSPLELDWGDSENDKGFFILDVKDNSYQYFPNKFSPRHIRLYYSKVKKKIENFSEIQNNYIKLVIDTKYKFEHVMKIINFINTKSPIKPCEADFVYNDTFNALQNLNISDDEDVVMMSKLDYMKKFIDEYFDSEEENTDGMDKNLLVKLTEDLYTKTLNE